jgi:hypothetical protein
MRADRRKRIETGLRLGLYPVLLGTTLWYAWVELNQPAGQLGKYYGCYLCGLVGLMVLVESLHPLRSDWKMTRFSFFRRDLPFLIIGSTTLGLANYAGGWAILHYGLTRGDSHAAHHLPQQVYVMMHAVAHPLNTFAVRLILTAPLFFLGFSTEAIFVASLILGLQGLVSHFNVDIRVGWLNYVLVGTELHRYHHSADAAEAMNYGAVVPFWDILFGTFVYRPDAPPRALGVDSPSEYPADREILRVLGLPFARLQ